MSEWHEDHDGGVEAAGLGQLVDGVALDQLGEGLSEPLRGGASFAERSVAGLVFGGGERVECLLEHRAGEGGSRVNRPWSLPWPSSHMVSRVAAAAAALLLVEEFGFVGVGGVGVDDLEQPAAEDLQGLGVEVAGLLDQVALGLGDQVGVEAVGEVVDRPGDDLGLLDVHPALSERGAGRLVGLEGRRRAASSGARPGRVMVAVGEPVRGGGGTGLRRRRRSVSAWASSRAFSSASCAFGGQHLAEGGGGLGGVHRPQRDVRDRGQVGAHASDRTGHPVRVVGDRGHGSIQAPATDSRGPGTPYPQGIPGL